MKETADLVPLEAVTYWMNQRVAYRKCRETQHIQPNIRDEKGEVIAIDMIGGDVCVQVNWDYLKHPDGKGRDAGSWVKADWLQLAK